MYPFSSPPVRLAAHHDEVFSHHVNLYCTMPIAIPRYLLAYTNFIVLTVIIIISMISIVYT